MNIFKQFKGILTDCQDVSTTPTRNVMKEPELHWVMVKGSSVECDSTAQYTWETQLRCFKEGWISRKRGYFVPCSVEKCHVQCYFSEYNYKRYASMFRTSEEEGVRISRQPQPLFKTGFVRRCAWGLPTIFRWLNSTAWLIYAAVPSFWAFWLAKGNSWRQWPYTGGNFSEVL